ncbi:hypothetical protein [Streptomyces sp. Isolate_45]|uniref:hypothetical protein n=1 Tax=Streptomyces sp. Isolate_45 TaxID=2950111 RepID=UPI002481CD5E|nr:hypothetical protein [Streptomyces sp. Isolate_45]MDA5282894.1 hypothetical protein [Streptomyces sp. Isolate_45]
MAEHFVTLHCEPCPSCRFEARQRIVDGRLRWEESMCCARYEVRACDEGRAPTPPWVRERIIAAEGTVHLPVGGPDGVPLIAVRALYRLSLPELREARANGVDATPVEAALLRGAASAGVADSP